jgi:hypothetical protein
VREDNPGTEGEDGQLEDKRREGTTRRRRGRTTRRLMKSEDNQETEKEDGQLKD